MYSQYIRGLLPNVGTSKQITVLVFFQVNSRLVSLLKIVYVAVRVSDIFVFTVSFKDQCSSTLSTIYLAWIPQPLQFSLLPITLSTLHVVSSHNLDSL